MQQPPQQPPNGWGNTFHNDQTQQQPVYQHSYLPYQQQPAFMPPPPFPPRPPKKKMGRGGWCLIGIVAVIVLFTCIGTTALAGQGAQQNQTNTSPSAAQATHPPTTVATTLAVTTELPTTTPIAAPTKAPTATPSPLPTQPKVQPTPTPKPACKAVNNNPWCYNFDPGNLIYSPPAGFCSYFSCIGNFGKSPGYVIECNDGMYATSGGRSGSCSQHRGDLRPLYSH